MLNTNVNLDHMPDEVTVETLPEGVYRVTMYDNIAEVETEDGISYTADEVVFTLSNPVSDDEIYDEFDSWWEFGVENDSDREILTVEERLDALEVGFVSFLLGGDMA